MLLNVANTILGSTSLVLYGWNVYKNVREFKECDNLFCKLTVCIFYGYFG